MDIDKIKEDMSICYLQAITAVNGIGLERYHHDEDSTDVVIKKIIDIKGIGRFDSSIRVQLKSTSSSSQYSIGDNEITYKLKVKNYNDLCMDSTTPSILALLILPDDQNEWVSWSDEELLIRGRMYWLGLQGKSVSSNSNSVSVKIPKCNILNNQTVEALLITAAEEGIL